MNDLLSNIDIKSVNMNSIYEDENKILPLVIGSKIECPFKINGCDAIVDKKDLYSHSLNDCYFSGLKCKVCNSECIHSQQVIIYSIN